MIHFQNITGRSRSQLILEKQSSRPAVRRAWRADIRGLRGATILTDIRRMRARRNSGLFIASSVVRPAQLLQRFRPVPLNGAPGHPNETADLAVYQVQSAMQNQNILRALRQSGETLGQSSTFQGRRSQQHLPGNVFSYI